MTTAPAVRPRLLSAVIATIATLWMFAPESLDATLVAPLALFLLALASGLACYLAPTAYRRLVVPVGVGLLVMRVVHALGLVAGVNLEPWVMLVIGVAGLAATVWLQRTRAIVITSMPRPR